MFKTLLVAFLLAQPAAPIPEFQASVRVNYPAASSGTVFKVVPAQNGYTSYILSTGHMEKRENPTVEFFFMDDKKLDEPLTVKGRILFLVENSDRGCDFSVIQVTTKGKPAFIPFAKKDAKEKDKCLSIGCDLASKPQCYSCNVLNLGKHDYILENDSPKAGRSGGGLFLNHEIVGVCWGCRIWGDKEVNGLFTRVSVVRSLLTNAGYEYLLE